MPSPKERGSRIDPEREQKAAMAEHAYLSVDPKQLMGTLPAHQLRGWRIDLQGGEKTPRRLYHSAWMAAEEAYSLFFGQKTPSEVVPLFEIARREFKTVVGDKRTPSLLRLQARLGAASTLPLAEEFGGGDEMACEVSNKAYKEELVAIGKSALDYAKLAKATHDTRFIDMMTMLNLLNDEPRFFVVPVAARISNSLVDQEHQAHLGIFDDQHGYYPVAVVPEPSKDNMFFLEQSLLAHDVYKAPHPYGTLQAYIDTCRVIELGQRIDEGVGLSKVAQREFSELRLGIWNRAKHMTTVTDALKASLDNHLAAGTKIVGEKIVFRSREDVLKYYLQLDPNSSLVEAQPTIQRAVTFLESRPRSELTPEELNVLAWMQLDLGIQDAREQKFSASGHFNRATLLFSGLAENAKLRGDTLDYYANRVFQLTLPVYAAMAGNDAQLEDRVDDYRRQLSELAGQLYEKRRELSESRPEVAGGLAALEPQIAVVLLLSGEDRRTRDAIAVPSLFRQTEKRKGWDITAWSRTQEGYDFDFFGRVKLVNNTIDTAAATNPYKLADEDFAGDSLYNILNVMWGDAETVENFLEQEVWVNYLRDQVKSHFAHQLD